VVKGDFGPYWEDGLGSDARHTALHGANQQRIANAEIMSTLASVFDPARAPDRQRLDFAWKNLLLSDEHTWTSMIATAEPDHAQTLKQMSLKSDRVHEAARAIDETIDRSWAQLAATIGSPRQVLAVFNSQGFERSGWVETDVFPDREPFDLSRNRSVRHELLALRESALRSLGVGHARIRFRAEDVPPLGYKLYSLRPVGPKGRKAPVVHLDIADRIFESPHYRIELDPEAGGMTSVLDKELGVELIDAASPYRLGALLYVTGGDDYPQNSLYRYSKVLPPPRLSVHPAVAGRLVSARKLPFGTVLELESSAPNFPIIRTRILLHDQEKKIELTYELEKKAVRSREAVYFAFPFAGAAGASKPGAAPRFAYGSQNGWVDPARDIVAGGSREWFSVTHWAAARRPQFTAAVIPVDAPLIAFGDIARGQWPERFEPATGAVYSWVMNNYWPMNFPAEQGGSFRFRYVLRSYRDFDPATLTRDALAELNPLEASLLASGPATESPLPAATSLFDLGSPNLAMVTWKQAEDGRGSILRLLEISGKPGQTTLSSPHLRFGKAWKTSALEEDLLPLKVTSRGVELSFDGYEIVTLRLLDPQRLEDDRHASSHLSPARHYDGRRATRIGSGTRLW